jgi:hypothetical protein
MPKLTPAQSFLVTAGAVAAGLAGVAALVLWLVPGVERGLAGAFDNGAQVLGFRTHEPDTGAMPGDRAASVDASVPFVELPPVTVEEPEPEDGIALSEVLRTAGTLVGELPDTRAVVTLDAGAEDAAGAGGDAAAGAGDASVEAALVTDMAADAAAEPAPREAARVPCGPVTCPGDMECCNASCGICTLPGGVCSKAMCGVLMVPASVNCGLSTCNVGEVCCNAACGICTRPGGTCAQTCMSPMTIPNAAPCGMVTCNTGYVCCNASCGICKRPGEACSHRVCG